MADRNRWRRRRHHHHSTLPLQRPTDLRNTLSFWYCDIKMTAFNDFFFSFGRRHQRFLRAWFSIGIAFSIAASTGVFLILLWELVSRFYHLDSGDGNFLTSWLLGITQSTRANFSIVDLGVIVCSTLVAVTFHEFGHAIAAASQGIEVEYVAVFLAIIFPGAFVAFNYDFLVNSTLSSSLRIYCAGIWHNLVLCAVCAWTLLLLPSLLHPFFIHADGPLVLNVAPISPLSSYLSQGDVIISLDGRLIRNPQEWSEKLLQLNFEMNEGSYYFEKSESNSTFLHRRTKGYCVPTSWIEENGMFPKLHENLSCPDELTAFARVPCTPSSLLSLDEVVDNTMSDKFCFKAFTGNGVVKLNKCGDGWETVRPDTHCACQEDEICMAPVQIPGWIWVEISFSRPSSQCSGYKRNKSFEESERSISDLSLCEEVILFMGDAIALINEFTLSAYKPRQVSGVFLMYLPFSLEKVLWWTLRVSTSLALFNSLPAFFLDGECILETLVLQISFLRFRNRRRVLRLILCIGMILTLFAFFQIIQTLYRKSRFS